MMSLSDDCSPFSEQEKKSKTAALGVLSPGLGQFQLILGSTSKVGMNRQKMGSLQLPINPLPRAEPRDLLPPRR
jgi:hypothetical protein